MSIIIPNSQGTPKSVKDIQVGDKRVYLGTIGNNIDYYYGGPYPSHPSSFNDYNIFPLSSISNLLYRYEGSEVKEWSIDGSRSLLAYIDTNEIQPINNYFLILQEDTNDNYRNVLEMMRDGTTLKVQYLHSDGTSQSILNLNFIPRYIKVWVYPSNTGAIKDLNLDIIDSTTNELRSYTIHNTELVGDDKKLQGYITLLGAETFNTKLIWIE